MSSPISTTDGSLPSMMSMAEFSAWIMFMLATILLPFQTHQGLLTLQILRHLLEHILEHEIRVESRPLAHGAERDRFLPTRCHQRLEFGGQGLMASLGPLAESDQVHFQSEDGIAQRTMLGIVLGAIARQIVAGRMSRPAIGHQFNQRGT